MVAMSSGVFDGVASGLVPSAIEILNVLAPVVVPVIGIGLGFRVVKGLIVWGKSFAAERRRRERYAIEQDSNQ